jgi:hypothetical protein
VYCDKSGYGHFYPNEKVILAHRYSYELHKGPIPEGMKIFHECDNGSCVNPRHLYVGIYKTDMENRFWKHVNKKENDECWVWSAACTSHGYGIIGKTGGKRLALTHRYSYELHYGSIPEDMDICHECDNPPCVNPNHLFIGTAQDNIIDAVSKGRVIPPVPRLGENNNKAKLTVNQVKEIKKMLSSGVKGRDIAAEFATSEYNISDIKRGKTWSHIILDEKDA